MFYYTILCTFHLLSSTIIVVANMNKFYLLSKVFLLKTNWTVTKQDRKR